MFTDIWSKTRDLMEGSDIESVKAKTGNLEDIKKKAPEATKHVQGSVSKDKGTQAPAAKEGDLDDAVSHAPEAKKHVEGSVSTEKGTKAPAPKNGKWEDVKKKSAEATKHVTLKESEEKEEEEEDYGTNKVTGEKLPKPITEEGEVETKEVKTEGSDIEGTKASKTAPWEDHNVKHAAEAKKHIMNMNEGIQLGENFFTPLSEEMDDYDVDVKKKDEEITEGMYEEGIYEEEMGGEENVGELVADKIQDVLSSDEVNFLAQAYTKGGKEMVASVIDKASSESVNEDSNTEPPAEGEYGLSRNEIKLRQILDKLIHGGAIGSLIGILPAAMAGSPFLAIGLGVASLVGCGLKDAAWWKSKATNASDFNIGGEAYPHHHAAQGKYGVK